SSGTARIAAFQAASLTEPTGVVSVAKITFTVLAANPSATISLSGLLIDAVTLFPSTVTASCSVAVTGPASIPTEFSASAVSCSQIDLTWSAPSDSAGSGLRAHSIYVLRNGAWALLKQVPAPATSTSDTGL